MRVAAVIAAAGKGKRLKTKVPKSFLPVSGKPILAWTLLNLARAYGFEEIIVTAGRAELGRMRDLAKRQGLRRVRVVAGGKTRALSVKNGVASVSPACDWVLVHDAARPLVSARLVKAILEAAKKSGAAICALRATVTIKKTDIRGKAVLGTEDRRRIFLAQTPQVFKKELLLQRYAALGRKISSLTDEASFFDGTHVVVQVVPGETRNIKITTPEDLDLFKYYLKKSK